jgi:hypothetical protein
MSGTSEVLTQNEIARLFLRIEVRHMPIIGWNGGGDRDSDDGPT